MKKCEAPVVRCEYTKAEKSLSHLVEESFRLYLSRILAEAGNLRYHVGDEWSLISRRKRCTLK